MAQRSPTRWRRRKEARPDEILAAALESFAERGFAATRLEDVATRAGISKGTLYLYFRSKEELFKAVVRATLLPNLVRVEALAASFEGPSALLLEGLAGISVGLITFFWPGITALALLYLIAAWSIVTGILELMVAVWMQRVIRNEWMLLLGGIASMLVGVLLALRPGMGLVAVTWLIGVYALIFGVLLLALALQWRRLGRGLVIIS